MSNRHMDRKAVVKLAQEAGLSVQEGNSFADDMYISVLYRFANLVASQDSDRVSLSADRCNPAHEALQHELSMIHSTIESFETPAAALRALIDWHCAVAVDPKVNGGKVLVPVNSLHSIMELAGVTLVYQPFGSQDRQHFDALCAAVKEQSDE